MSTHTDFDRVKVSDGGDHRAVEVDVPGVGLH